MFEFQNNNLKISFKVDSENKVYCDFFGYRGINFLKNNQTIKNNHIVEMETGEENHNGNHCDKFTNTPYGATAKYVSHSFINNRELIITTKNDYFEVETHYLFYPNVSGFSIYNIVKNISKEERIIEYISSFYLHNYGNENGRNDINMFLHKAHNSWNTEAQWKRLDFLHEGLFNSNEKVSMERYQINNTGSWSTKEYLPMVGIEDQNKQLFLLGQVESNCSWHIELGDNANSYYLSLSGPEYIDNQWAISLKPNQTFKTVQASIVLAFDFESSVQEITKLRRHLILKSKDQEELPIIYNDFMHGVWNVQKEEQIIPLINKASEAGADVFVIDAGWFFPGGGWPDYIGKWETENSNFPNGGLLGLTNYITQKKMKVGIWTEIEMMGVKCPLASQMPDEYFFHLHGKKIIRNNRYCLNFAHPKVYKWALETLSNIIRTYKIDYLKNDYNQSVGAGNDYGYLTPGEGLLEHSRALINLFKELESKFPDLTIESCASGGLRMDYEMLKVCSIQSTSDQEYYQNYPFIVSNIFTAVLPEQAGIWCYPVDSRHPNDTSDEQIVMNVVNALMGRIHLASNLNLLTPEKFCLLKEGILLYNRFRKWRKEALPIFPNGANYFFNDYAVSGLINEKIIWLTIWSTSKEKEDCRVNLSKYNVQDIKVLYPTQIETNYWFNKETSELIFKPNTPYSARIFEVKVK